MIIAARYDVPDKCPRSCPFINDFRIYGQNAVCCYCPVFLCRKPGPGTESNIIPPEDYREDWAGQWSEWFRGDMKNFPVLNIQQLTEKAYSE